MKKSLRFRFKRINLTVQQVDQLIQEMEADKYQATDFDLVEEGQKNYNLNLELKNLFETEAVDQLRHADPTSLDDDALWLKIKAALPQQSPQARPSQIQKRWARSAFLGLVATALLLVFWPKSEIPEEGRRFKGVFFGSEGYEHTACRIAFRTAGNTIDLSDTTDILPASQAALILAQCQASGFLHLAIEAEGQTLQFTNLPVSAASTWQELQDIDQAPVALMLPSPGPLVITAGFSLRSLSPEETAQLTSGDRSKDDSVWQWMRQDQLSIGAR